MSYFLRGTFLFLGSFFLVYTVLSLAVACGWHVLNKRVAARDATFLYAIRVFPLAGAVAVVVLLIMPSFLLREPYRTDETIALWGGALACGGLAVIVFGVVSVVSAWWNTHRFVASCSGIRRELQPGASAVVITTPGPVLLVAGICRPKLLISKRAGEILDHREMQAAIRHELAHVRFCDNLRRLVLRFCRFPLLAGLEREWMRAAELAADDAAATDQASALDLASALLKMASRSCAAPIPEVAMSLVSECDNALQVRVQRLLAWHPAATRRSHKVLYALPAVSVIVLFVMGCGPLLERVHELTELFVR